MSTDNSSAAPSVPSAQQRYQQFLQLLPLTVAIAGLPPGETGKYFNDDQMDLRARSLKNAYKQARKLIKEVMNEG